MVKHTLHHAGLLPNLRNQHTANCLYTYMSLVCRLSTQSWKCPTVQKKSPYYSCLVLTKVGETVSLEVVSAHKEFFANCGWDLAFKHEFNPRCSPVPCGWGTMESFVLF